MSGLRIGNNLSKLIDRKIAKEFARRLKEQNKIIVFTNGCFDILHAGHVGYLADSKKFGDFLIVGLNSDSSVRRIKGKGRPIFNQEERAEALSGLKCVNGVIIFDEDTPMELIKEIVPHVLVKGSDWNINSVVGKDVVEASGGKVVTVPIIGGASTTSIIEKAGK